jgi:hypothetical protein
MSDRPKDFWDKLEVVLSPLGGLLTAVAVGSVGFMGSQVLNKRQSIDTNARLYSELMSRREESESSLRKDMFVSIIDKILQPSPGDLDAKVLNLELLAYNFHDSLDLKPLFLDVNRKLDGEPKKKRDELEARLIVVAKEIAAKQLFSLEGHGRSFRRAVDLEELKNAGPGGLALEGEVVRIGDQTCDISLRVLKADPEHQQIWVRVTVKATEGSDLPDTRATFEVGWYDFPMIDNTRLANGLRCAVTLANFSKKDGAAELTTTCFPGEYASLKDRPYYDEVIQKLQQAAWQQEAAESGR